MSTKAQELTYSSLLIGLAIGVTIALMPPWHFTTSGALYNPYPFFALLLGGLLIARYGPVLASRSRTATSRRGLGFVLVGLAALCAYTLYGLAPAILMTDRFGLAVLVGMAPFALGLVGSVLGVWILWTRREPATV